MFQSSLGDSRVQSMSTTVFLDALSLDLGDVTLPLNHIMIFEFCFPLEFLEECDRKGKNLRPSSYSVFLLFV